VFRDESMHMPFASNPFDVMALLDAQEPTSFFERRVSTCEVRVSGEVAFDHAD
jgi:hypothetical protein